MTEPKRWSSPESDVDPVLRSVLRYGRDLSPTSAQLGAIVAGATSRSPSSSRRRSARALWSLAAVAAVFVAGAAFAGYAASQRANPAPAPTAPAAPGIAAPRPVSGAPAARTLPAEPAQEPVITPSEPALEPSAPALPTRSAAAAASVVAPAVDAARDAQLLQEARSLVASNPARALTLTRDHELHFPASALAEERQALQIEALARLGRRAEAARALASFKTSFPRSIYERRLQALELP